MSTSTNNMNSLINSQPPNHENQEDELSLLDEMNAYFDNKGLEQDQHNNSTVIRAVANQGANTNQEILTRFYQKLEDLGMNLEELKPLLECQENLLVLSGAGAGKTTALILKIIRDLLSGEMMKTTVVNSVYGQTYVQVPSNILISTFLKTGAEELKQAFHEWCRKLDIRGLDASTIQFRTIHSEVLDTLKKMGVNVQILENGDTLLKTVMNKYGIRSLNSTSRSITIDEMNDVAGIVAYARNRLDKKRYEQQLMEEYRIDSILLDALLNDLKLMRRAMGQMDFEDMQEMLLEALQMNPNVQKVVADRYEYVYIDEFQDTSQLQYELLKYYFANARRVIAVGDDDQAIYSFRGSDPDIITTKFEQDIKPTVLKLTTNYRCRANILNPVISSIELNTNRHEKNLKAHKPGGEVNVIMNGNVNELITSMKQDLANKMKVGILARVNADLLIPAMILELDGTVEFGVSKAVNMSSRLPRQVFGIIDLITKRLTQEFESYLRLFLPRYNWFEADKLYNVLLNNKSLNLHNIPIEDLKYSVPTLAPIIQGLREANKMGGVEAYLFLLGVLENQAFQGKSLYAQKARNLVQFVKRIIMEHKDVKDLSIGQIDILFNQTLPERLSRRSKYARDVFAKLTTVHEAKGKEWDSVYIWNDTEGSFPNIVGNRPLTQEEFEEERRVHYIAWTRAKDKLTVFSDASKPGVFLKECDLTKQGTNVHTSDIPTDMNRVFKKAPQQIQTIQTDTILRQYIHEVNLSGLADEKQVNMDIVLRNFQFEELTERLENQYGIHLTTEPEDQQETLNLFFSSLADEVFNKGTYQA